ncbi:MAG: GerMN domain-containing protein [Fusobacteriaceae bacterium]
MMGKYRTTNSGLTKNGVIIILLAILLGMGYFFWNRYNRVAQNIVFDESLSTKNSGGFRSAKIFVPSADFSRIEKIDSFVSNVRDENSYAKEIVKAVSREMKNRKLITEDFEAQAIFFDNKIAYVDLKDTPLLHKNQQKTLMILSAITNSLIDIGGTNRVRFLVNGKVYDGIWQQFYSMLDY